MRGNPGKPLEKYNFFNGLACSCFARETAWPAVSHTLSLPASVAKHSRLILGKFIYINGLSAPCFACETGAARSGHDPFARRNHPARHPRPLSARNIAWPAASV
jgi:hypothetical protein